MLTGDARNGSRPSSAAVLVLLMILWLLIGPRVDLVSVGMASIRLEDCILLALAAYALSSTFKAGPALLGPRVLAATLSVGLIAVLSAFINSALGRVELAPALLYGLRPLEYWVVLPASVLAFRTISAPRWRLRWFERTLSVATVCQVGVAVLQTAGLQIGFSKFSYERAAGLTAGPYELGALCGILLCYWAYRRRALMVLLSALGLVLSQSRISLIAAMIGLIIVFVSREWRASRQTRTVTVAQVVTTTAIAIVAIVGAPTLLPHLVSPTAERVADTSIIDAWSQAVSAADSTEDITSSAQYASIAYERIGMDVTSATQLADASNVVRFYRWNLLLESLKSDPIALIIGLGPSFAGPSVDGSVLRVFAETGVLGLFAWSVWLVVVLRRGPAWLLSCFLCLIVGSLFIDLLFALRPMVLFWFLAGYARSQASAADETQATDISYSPQSSLSIGNLK